MDEVWERAVEAALDGQEDSSAARSLTLDGAVKCVQGRLPPPALLEKFEQLKQLSIANIGVSSLADFPRLKHLEKLILSDNRIAGGLEFLVQAGLQSLRDLDLSNNKIQYVEDLEPLAQLKLDSLDLYECPVTRVANYRARVFGMIKSLKYLDKADAEENERPESDEEEDEEDDEDDGGSGEVEGEENCGKAGLGPPEEEESEDDGDECEEDEEGTVRFQGNNTQYANHSQARSNGSRIGSGIESRGDEDDEDTSSEEDDDAEDVEDEDEESLRFRQGPLIAKASNFGGPINAESSSDDEDEEEDDVENAEVQDVEESEEDDGDGDDDDEDDEDDDGEEEVDLEDEEDEDNKVSSGPVEEIDAHENEDDDENGELELGEEDGTEDEEDEEEVEEEVEYEEEEDEEDYGTEYLVQPVRQLEDEATSEVEPGLENGDGDGDGDDDDEDDDDDDDREEYSEQQQRQATPSKRKRGDNDDDDTEDSDEDERPPRKR